MHPLPAEPSSLLVIGFVLLSLAMALALAAASRSSRFAGLLVLWLGLTGGLAASGALAHFDTLPPRPVIVFVLGIASTFALGFGSVGARLMAYPLGWIVGLQGFRVLVEILIHQATLEGVAPMNMSWDGLNFDIATGLTALILAPFAARVPRWLLGLWNLLGLGLLVWIVGVAVVSMPTPLRLLTEGVPNVWVGHFPFVWLPTVLVLAALLGHIVLFRRLRVDARV